MVAHLLPKERVAGSSPVYRSHLRCFHRCKIKLKVSVPHSTVTAWWGNAEDA